jgi:pSer/pThr/pTyr-binding forkhead associated (FHA) protein
MSKEISAFLRIEKLAKGKIEGYEYWDEIPLGVENVLIGRPSSSQSAVQPDIRITGDDYISRNQAEIYYSVEDNSYMIRDTGSLNQTFLNSVILEKTKTYRLRDHDLIGLSKINNDMRVVFRFRSSEATLPSWVEEQAIKPGSRKGLNINIATHSVTMNGKEIPLTRKEYEVLKFLHYKKGEACRIDEIAWEVWGDGGASDELVVKYISRLRDKLEHDSTTPVYIITVPGRHGCYILELG